MSSDVVTLEHHQAGLRPWHARFGFWVICFMVKCLNSAPTRRCWLQHDGAARGGPPHVESDGHGGREVRAAVLPGGVPGATQNSPDFMHGEDVWKGRAVYLLHPTQLEGAQ